MWTKPSYLLPTYVHCPYISWKIYNVQNSCHFTYFRKEFIWLKKTIQKTNKQLKHQYQNFWLTHSSLRTLKPLLSGLVTISLCWPPPSSSQGGPKPSSVTPPPMSLETQDRGVGGGGFRPYRVLGPPRGEGGVRTEGGMATKRVKGGIGDRLWESGQLEGWQESRMELGRRRFVPWGWRVGSPEGRKRRRP